MFHNNNHEYYLFYGFRNIVCLCGFFQILFNYDEFYKNWTEHHFYPYHYKYREYTYYQRIHIFSDPQLILSRSIVAALANALQPPSPIYHVSYHRVSYVTQLSLFNDGGRAGIGLRIGRNLRAKPRPPVDQCCQHRTTISARSLSAHAY